jgi:tetratricopeptide (TPR) repeat protein
MYYFIGGMNMNVRKKWMKVLLVGLVVLSTQVTFAEPAQEAVKAFAEGKALLKKGDFNAAKKAYALAAKTDPEKQEYRQQYSIVSRVIKIRESLNREKSPVKWNNFANSLRNFYLENEIYSEALILSTQIHEKLNTPDSAVQLAQVQLHLEKNADAVKTLSTLDPKKTTPLTQTYLALALAEEGKTDQAKAIVEKIVVPQGANYKLFFPLASLYAKIGDSSKAISTLTLSFETTPLSSLTAYKDAARTSKSFASITKTPEFEKALKTETKIKESKCSGGSDCSKCPSRTPNCPSEAK